MANELLKNGKKSVAVKGLGAPKKHAKKAAKHAAKKAAKKAAKQVGAKVADLGPVSKDGVRTAFHHMQRASVVISLMEKDTGEDLRGLLARGVKLYEQAHEGKGGESTILKAIGLLRAAEHLAMAGLYAARHKHREKVKAPSRLWLDGLLAETNARLKRVEGLERGKGADLFSVTEELALQASETGDDPHMAFELALAADALCFALENGL
ncbi:MAG: hypothetical protein ABI197_06435 [Granulicella sp.]